MGRPKVKNIDDSQIEESTVIASEEKQSSQEETSEKIATSPEAPRNDEKKKTQKPGKAKPRSKKYQETTKELDKSQTYQITEAVEMAKKLSYSKFPGTLEIHINTRVPSIRGLVTLPFVAGKKLNILAFGPSASSGQAKELGSIEGLTLGTEETIDELIKGSVKFDIIITTPDWMPKLAKAARTLGPKGLMPNPKNGTITDDLKKAVEGFQAGKTEYRTEAKAPIIHLALGKLSQPTEELSENIRILLTTIGKSRIKKAVVTPTVGPSVKLDLSSI